ncbi:protein of unknown function DUF323 [Desulfatibacillum aliphaticivorans]|uniref:Sulfatase-modifying factor enzyme-like domain-containing protein n=1 Tax=Desulfatibacillum aliphaticivorans TaxID=218208 RepID=B8FBV9_DESAL|nr:formylglycine-generating enzyme family protein [Desulfatibacillum aliphaticivorans]ACL05164.1 protein of unknown function DUF323 [Desulfatibacillum aliphaticivorans]
MAKRLLSIIALIFLLAMFAVPAAAHQPKIGMDLSWRIISSKGDAPTEPQDKPGDVFVEPVTGMEFVFIPGQCFMMGSTGKTDPDRYQDEGPIHKVCLDGFWMGRYEVTNAQYHFFRPGHDSGEYEGHPLNMDAQPVVNVSWKNARAFAIWLSAQNQGQYSFWLPTEAEWEFACRAGTETSRYWGDDVSQTCQYANVADQTAGKYWPSWNVHPCNDGFAVSAPVGSFSPNAFGLYDMMGNVWEACQDWKAPYRPGEQVNPAGPQTGKRRMVRGGSWDNESRGIRSANRSYATPSFKRYNNGFRLVRTR